MEKLLLCKVSPGQFSNEYAVEGTLSNGSGFSMFTHADSLTLNEKPTRDKPVEGWMKIDILEEKGDIVLVSLPQTTLENGRFITVKKEQTKDIYDTIK